MSDSRGKCIAASSVYRVQLLVLFIRAQASDPYPEQEASHAKFAVSLRRFEAWQGPNIVCMSRWRFEAEHRLHVALAVRRQQ